MNPFTCHALRQWDRKGSVFTALDGWVEDSTFDAHLVGLIAQFCATPFLPLTFQSWSTSRHIPNVMMVRNNRVYCADPNHQRLYVCDMDSNLVATMWPEEAWHERISAVDYCTRSNLLYGLWSRDTLRGTREIILRAYDDQGVKQSERHLGQLSTNQVIFKMIIHAHDRQVWCITMGQVKALVWTEEDGPMPHTLPLGVFHQEFFIWDLTHHPQGSMAFIATGEGTLCNSVRQFCTKTLSQVACWPIAYHSSFSLWPISLWFSPYHDRLVIRNRDQLAIYTLEGRLEKSSAPGLPLGIFRSMTLEWSQDHQQCQLHLPNVAGGFLTLTASVSK